MPQVSKKVVSTHPSSDAVQVCFSGQKVWTAAKSVQVFDNNSAWTAATERQKYEPHEEPLTVIASTKTGSFVATGGEDRQVYLYNTSEPSSAPTLFTRCYKPIRCVLFDDTGRRLVVGADDGLCKILRLDDKKHQILSVQDNIPVLAAAWSPDSCHLAAVNADGQVKLWKFADQNTVEGIVVKSVKKAVNRDIAKRPLGNVQFGLQYVTTTNGDKLLLVIPTPTGISFLNSTTLAVEAELNHTEIKECRCFKFNSNGTHVGIADATTNQVFVFDCRPLLQEQQQPLLVDKVQCGRVVTSLTWQNTTLAVAEADGTVSMWYRAAAGSGSAPSKQQASQSSTVVNNNDQQTKDSQGGAAKPQTKKQQPPAIEPPSTPPLTLPQQSQDLLADESQQQNKNNSNDTKKGPVGVAAAEEEEEDSDDDLGGEACVEQELNRLKKTLNVGGSGGGSSKKRQRSPAAQSATNDDEEEGGQRVTKGKKQKTKKPSNDNLFGAQHALLLQQHQDEDDENNVIDTRSKFIDDEAGEVDGDDDEDDEDEDELDERQEELETPEGSEVAFSRPALPLVKGLRLTPSPIDDIEGGGDHDSMLEDDDIMMPDENQYPPEGGATAIGTYCPRPQHTRFQPGATPLKDNNIRLLACNSIGRIESKLGEDGVTNITIEFVDQLKHKPEKITDRLSFTMAALGEVAAVFATGEEAAQSTILYRPLTAFKDVGVEWSINMQPGEFIVSLAIGKTWVSAFTNRFLRVFSCTGLENAVLSWGYQHVVSSVGSGDQLAVVSDNGSGTLLCDVFDVVKHTQIHQAITVSLTTTTTELIWIGWSDEGLLSTCDSEGVVRVLTSEWGKQWVPVWDPTRDGEGTILWPTGLTEDKLYAFKCQRGERYPGVETWGSGTHVQDLSVPVLAPGPYREAYLRFGISNVSLKNTADHYNQDVRKSDGRLDKCLLKLFENAVKSEKASRALDLASQINLKTNLDVAINMAHENGASRLVDKLRRLEKGHFSKKKWKSALPEKSQKEKDKLLKQQMRDFKIQQQKRQQLQNSNDYDNMEDSIPTATEQPDTGSSQSSVFQKISNKSTYQQPHQTPKTKNFDSPFQSFAPSSSSATTSASNSCLSMVGGGGVGSVGGGANKTTKAATTAFQQRRNDTTTPAGGGGTKDPKDITNKPHKQKQQSQKQATKGNNSNTSAQTTTTKKPPQSKPTFVAPPNTTRAPPDNRLTAMTPEQSATTMTEQKQQGTRTFSSPTKVVEKPKSAAIVPPKTQIAIAQNITSKLSAAAASALSTMEEDDEDETFVVPSIKVNK